MNRYIIYSDGSLKGNWALRNEKPLRGGYAAIICDEKDNIINEVYGGFLNTTSPRAEIYGVLAGLKAIEEPSEIIIKSDSQYVVGTVNDNWLSQILKNPDKFSNADLWIQVAELLDFHKVTFVWIKGHADNEINNKADALAQFSAKLLNLPEDEYINNSKEVGEPLVSKFKTRRSNGFDSRQENGTVVYSLG